jgi:hypothetical protein
MYTMQLYCDPQLPAQTSTPKSLLESGMTSNMRMQIVSIVYTATCKYVLVNPPRDTDIAGGVHILL